MTLPRTFLRYAFPMPLLAYFIWLASLGGLATGQDVNEQVVQASSVGFSQNLRLGHWTSVSFHLNPAIVRPTDFEITCPDADGTLVTYRGDLISDNTHPNVVQAWFRMGRRAPSIAVKLNSDNETMDRFSLFADQDYIVQPSTQKMILTVESSQRIEDSITVSLANIQPKPLVVTTRAKADLPLNEKCYQGIDQMILAARDRAFVDSIGIARLKSIMRWVNDGGRLILCVGQGGAELLATGKPLFEFCPGTFQDVIPLESGQRIELFASSDTQLLTQKNQTIPAAKISETSGVIALAEGDLPLIIEQSFGLGRITFVSVDIDSGPFEAWNGMGNLTRKIVLGDEENYTASKQTGGRVSHYGYDDLVGQLRVPLDQFSRVKFVTFTWVAVLIGLYILFIGPVDYFLLRKLVGRMELTWLTFGLITAAFCALAWFVVKNTKPNRIQINQLEIIDIDAIGGKSRGMIWANLFSPTTTKLDLDIEPVNSLGFDIRSSELVWHGLPGKGLGGMETVAATSIASENYQITVARNPADQSQEVSIFGLPTRVSSSKSLFAIWKADNAIKPVSNLRYNARINQLEGTLTNPFDKTLINGRILFEDWVYVVGRPLDPGETIDIVTETREKNARRYFSRRVSKDDKGVNVPWNPTDTRINRIADMLMFYKVAGGRGYTGLGHDYQSFVDLSHIPFLNRAILVGELDEHTTDVLINGETRAEDYDRQLTVLRIILPVDRKKTKSK